MSIQLIHLYFETGILSMDDRIIITSGSNLMTKRRTRSANRRFCILLLVFCA